MEKGSTNRNLFLQKFVKKRLKALSSLQAITN